MRRNFAFLQVLRAVAALLVVADHAIYYLEPRQAIPDWAHHLAWHLGSFGVDVFFVISGFIMAYTSRSLFNSGSGWATFAWRRIIRIVPMYWLATAVEMLLRLRHLSGLPRSSLLYSLFFIPVVTDPGQPLRPFLGVGWTLNHEMFFYGLFATGLLFSRRAGTILIVTQLCLLVWLGSFAKPLSDTADPVTVFTFITNPLILLFAGGVLTAVVLEPAVASGTTHRLAGPAALGLTLGAAVLFMVAVNREPWPLGYQTVFWGVAAAVVVLGVFAPNEGTYGLRWMEKIGDASYSIYLFHFIAIAGFGRAWVLLFGAIEPLPFVLLSIVIAALSGWAIHLTVERPLLDRLRHFGGPRGLPGSLETPTRSPA